MPSTLRASMEDLIAMVRTKIGDAPGGCQQFADTDIQDALDARAEYIRYEVLYPQVKYTPSAYQYLFYKSIRGFWENAIELIDRGYNPLTPSSADLIAGYWTFPAGGGNGQYPPVFLAGKTYDVWGACADLVDAWQAVYARQFSFSTGGASFDRAQVAVALDRLAASFRRRARIKQVKVSRDDVNPNAGAPSNREVRLGPVSAGVPFITGE